MSHTIGHLFISSGFWNPALAVLAVAIGLYWLYREWKDRDPRGKLYYAIDSDASLLPAKSIKGVEVRYGDKPLAAPRAVRLVLRNGMRGDITRDAFDGTPFCLDIGEHVKIIECLNVSTAPSDQPMPQVTTDGSKLVIAPVKIGSREVISVELLIDGESPQLRAPMQTLNNVEIRPKPGVRPLSSAWSLVGWWCPLLVLLVYFGTHQPPKGADVSGVGLALAATLIVGLYIGMQLGRRAIVAYWFDDPK